jgi:hypothetical protein
MAEITKDTQRIEVMTVTPETAAEWLKLNVNNRPMRPHRVNVLAHEMVRGQWKFTGDSIKFSEDGHLIDGQHRLAACVKANMPLQIVVVCGLPNESFNVLDRNLGRTAGDVLSHHGIKSYKNVAAAARLVIGYEAGVIQNSHEMTILTTPGLILEEVQKHLNDYMFAINMANRGQTSAFNNSALGAFVVLCVRRFGAPMVDEFIEPCLTGAMLSLGDPRIALRNQVAGPARPRNNVDSLALMIRAWNAWRRNETRKLIKGWSRSDPFPSFDERSAPAPDAS